MPERMTIEATTQIRKIRTLHGYTAFARSLAETAETDIVIESSKLPHTPFSFSRYTRVMRETVGAGRLVCFCETGQRVVQVWEVGAADCLPASVDK